MKLSTSKVFIFLAFVLAISCVEEYSPDKIIQKVGKTYVPDSRVGVFSITATKVGGKKLLLKGETDNEKALDALITRLQDSLYSVVDSVLVLPDNISSPWGVVTLSVANLRSSASHDAEMITQALMGTPLKILKETSDWAFVQTPDGYLAWCEKDAYAGLQHLEMAQWQNSERVVVVSLFAIVSDLKSNKPVSDVVAGCILQQTSLKGTEMLVRLPDGRVGKIQQKDVLNFETWRRSDGIKSENLIRTAENVLGIPYLWGGTSVKGADCSGFTKTVYFLNGYILSRDASQQANYGIAVPIKKDWKNFLPGDLLFFGHTSSNDQSPAITHVGMYLGDSEFIHSSGRVRINSFDSTRTNYSQYRSISLINVRRIIGTENTEGIRSIKTHPWY